jgi:hypothetical protein
MQLRNGVQTLDAYQPTFDPGLDVATVVFSHIECVKTRASLAKVSKLWRDASKPTTGLCALPAELKALILSKIEHIEAHHVLALSSTFQEAFSLLRALRALPRTFYFGLEGVESVLADHLVRVLDDDRVRSLGKERALELMGEGNKDRLCQYACGRNFEVLKWAFNELNLPWAQYPAGPVSDDVLALRVLRDAWQCPCCRNDRWWPVGARPEDWEGVTMENGRVVKLELNDICLDGAVPAEIGRLTSLTVLNLGDNELTSLPAEIGQLTSLTELSVGNQLTSVPAEIWQLTSLTYLNLGDNQLTSVPAEIGQLTSLRELLLDANQLTSLPSEIGQLTSLRELHLHINQLTSLPAEIGQLTSLKVLNLHENQLTSVPAAIRELRAAGCDVYLDDGVTYDIRSYMRAHG